MDTIIRTYAGLDAGHNNLKLLIQDEGADKPVNAIIPSYILTDKNLFASTSPSTPGFVQYIDGARQDLFGNAWLMGRNAIEANEKASVPLAQAQDGKGKVEFSLHSLLSLLSTLPHRPEWNLVVSLSNHRADVYASILKSRMEGYHSVSLSGRISEITVRVVEVVDEATHYKPKVGSEVVLLDFGGGTTIYVKYSKEGKNVSRDVVEAGVDDLINLLYDSPEIYALLHKDRSRHGLRVALEGKGEEVWYGIKDRGGINITAPYLKCLQTWIKAYLKSVLVQTQKSLREGATLELIGGGAMLPHLESVLTQILTKGGQEKHVINKVGKSALWINAYALLSLSQSHKFLEEEANGRVKKDVILAGEDR